MVIGIDLGTTNSLVTVFKDGESVLIPNEYGELLTPSVVGFDDNNELIIGKIAKERLVVAPSLTTCLFKRKMGQNVKVKLGEKEFSPEALSSIVLKKLIANAESFLGEKVEEAVVSVPAYFNSKQRAATKKAGQLAGIKVERLVNEPSAAAIACLNDEDEDDTFIVFDFGGGTLDVSVVERFDNVINICAISGDNYLGGIDFDMAILKAFCDENNILVRDLSNSQRQTLLRVAEEAKISLQLQTEAQLQLVIDDKMLRMNLTNEKLVKLSKDVFKRIRKPIAQAMKDSSLEAADISRLILVGGSCEMKIVQDYLKELLQIPVVNHDDTDQIVAKGLGAYVGIKARKQEVKDLVLTDICPFSLSIGAMDYASRYVSAIMISRNSVLPTRITKDFYSHIGQKQVELNIYQGEEMYADDNMLLGKLLVEVPKNKNSQERIDVTFFYDINSILVVKANILSTKKVFSYVLGGDGLEVRGAESKKYLDQYSLVDLKFAQHQKQTLILERAKRIYAESTSEVKPYMQMMIVEIENIMGISSLRKLNEKLDEYEAILEEIEKAENKIDLFRDFEDEDEDVDVVDGVFDGFS